MKVFRTLAWLALCPWLLSCGSPLSASDQKSVRNGAAAMMSTVSPGARRSLQRAMNAAKGRMSVPTSQCSDTGIFQGPNGAKVQVSCPNATTLKVSFDLTGTFTGQCTVSGSTTKEKVTVKNPSGTFSVDYASLGAGMTSGSMVSSVSLTATVDGKPFACKLTNTVSFNPPSSNTSAEACTYGGESVSPDLLQTDSSSCELSQ